MFNNSADDATVDVIADMWSLLRAEVTALSQRVDNLVAQTERSETAGGVAASTLINAPLAATGAMSNGISNVDILWISNGRKSGEGAGLGTGVLAVYQASTDAWLRLTDYTAVVV